MSPSRSSLRHRHLAIGVVVAAAALAPIPAALAWPSGTCEPAKDKGCVTDVAIAKAADRTTYAPGDVATYTITVTNTGNTAVDGARIRVSDPALADLAPDGPTTGWLLPGDSLTWTGTRALTAAECGELPNTATVSLAPTKKKGPEDANPANDSATVTVTVGGEACNPAPPTPPTPAPPVVPSPVVVAPPVATGKPVCPRPALRAVIRGPKHPTAGKKATYRVTVANRGPKATKVRVRLRLPAGASLPGARQATRLRGGDLVVGLGAVTRGKAKTTTVVLRLDRSVRGARVMKATVSARCGATTAATRRIQAVAAAPARVQPAVTG